MNKWKTCKIFHSPFSPNLFHSIRTLIHDTYDLTSSGHSKFIDWLDSLKIHIQRKINSVSILSLFYTRVHNDTLLHVQTDCHEIFHPDFPLQIRTLYRMDKQNQLELVTNRRFKSVEYLWCQGQVRCGIDAKVINTMIKSPLLYG